ncbi:WD40 repeat-like protein [Penicillium cf. griseofulvum]|nr:WD40 repeat-like protein [Penicillium cf. griseofulvum]
MKTFYIGMKEVTTRINWYSEMTDQLLQQNERPWQQVRNMLENDLCEIYQALLFYQIKSVCFYYKRQFEVYIRAMLKVDDWHGDLKSIADLEQPFQAKITQYRIELLVNTTNQFMSIGKDEAKLKYHDIMSSLFLIDPRCQMQDIENRKDKVIRDVYKWFLGCKEYQDFTNWESSSASTFLWINGQAGTGKTMLLIGIIHELMDQNPSPEAPEVLYFFYNGKDDNLNHASALIRSVMWFLLQQRPMLVRHLSEKYDNTKEKIFEGRFAFNNLSSVFKSMIQDPDLGWVVLIVDGLNECKDDDREQLIKFFQELRSTAPLMKCILSSRPLGEIEISIESAMKKTGFYTIFKLDDCSLKDPINIYISQKQLELEEIHEEYLDVEAAGNLITQLRGRASNTFIWVSLICQELSRTHPSYWSDILEYAPEQLTELYDFLLQRLEDPRPQMKTRFSNCKAVLALISITCRPLSLDEINLLAPLPKQNSLAVVRECRSFLAVQGDIVYPIHQSAQDYMSDKFEKLRDVSRQKVHLDVYRLSLGGMKTTLKRNIYNLKGPGVTSEEIQPPSPDPLRVVSYSCSYWAYHLEQSGTLSEQSKAKESKAIYAFFEEHFLHWVEAMSLPGTISHTVSLISLLQTIFETNPDLKLSDFLSDGKRFLFKNLMIAGSAPLQVYDSALTFAPLYCNVRKMFEHELPRHISRLIVFESHWGVLRRTLDHCYALAMSFSPDGHSFVKSWEERVSVWDTETGYLRTSFELSGPIACVVFSLDQKLLISGLQDGSIVAWDMTLGEKRWETSVSEPLYFIAFSSDGVLMAVASDGDLHIFDTIHRTPRWHIKGDDTAPKYAISMLDFCPNAELLVSSCSGPVKVWNSKTGELIHGIDLSHIIDQSGDEPTFVAFSPDGKLLAASFSTAIYVFEVATWRKQWEVETKQRVGAVSFSSDGHQIALSTYANGIQIFNSETGNCLGEIGRAGNGGFNLLFSPAHPILASYVYNCMIKLWDMKLFPESANALIPAPHAGIVVEVRFSPTGQQVASRAGGMILVWDVSTGTIQDTFHTLRDMAEFMEFSYDGKWLVSYTDDRGDLKIWNTETGELERQLDKSNMCDRNSERSSGDERLLMSNSEDIFEEFGFQLGTLRTPTEIEFKDGWIVAHEKILWIPPDYRPFEQSYAIYNRLFVGGTGSGHVIFIEIEA